MEEAKIFGDEDDFVGLDDPVQRDVLGQGPATSKYQASALRSMKSSHIQKRVLRCKVLLVGAPHVGKTSLCQVFQNGGQNFPKSYLMTLGVDFSVTDLQAKQHEDTQVEMYIYDTGGQSVFNQRELGGQYWSNASVAVYVYDAGNRNSFLSCSKWLSSVRSENSGRPMPGILVANKVDLRESGRIEVTRETGETFAKDNGLTFLETSALRNSGVTELFQFIAD
eukprot:CAMPEP_0171572052 /NCGR_PEP_ID=MMETSP0961-20121227/3872_1 /TAXON_ID=87120 /ORGANISM="Aurantiochytrium limacinum, Strain ATCCMYA-1381" /LENGTH=222 /DNA_ID=CAMNT_0012126783 /DNA_START=131 /DNA_END=796 /DNA_ORIENTATION=-